MPHDFNLFIYHLNNNDQELMNTIQEKENQLQNSKL